MRSLEDRKFIFLDLFERERSIIVEISLSLSRSMSPTSEGASPPPPQLQQASGSARATDEVPEVPEEVREMGRERETNGLFDRSLLSHPLSTTKKKKLLVPLRRVGAPSRDHRRRLQALPGSALSQRGPGLRRLPLRGVHGRARRAARGFGLEGGRLGLSGRPRTTQACRARPGAGGGAVRGAGSGRGRGQGEGEAGGAGGGRREGSGDRERRRRRRGGREEKGEEMKKKCFLLRERENEEGCGCFLSLSLSLVTPSQVPQCAN